MSSLAAASTRQAFDTVTELTDPGDGTFRGLVSAAWTIGGRPNGRPGPVTVTAEVLRTGRSASQVWARMGQADQACVEALITVGHLDRDTSAHWGVGAPAIPQVAFDDAQTSSLVCQPETRTRSCSRSPSASIPNAPASHAGSRADAESCEVGSPYPAMRPSIPSRCCALRAGASGFLLKRTRPEELIAAVHTVATGDSLLSPSVTRRVIERMARQPAPDLADRAWLEQLTPRERDVLLLVARGLSNREIAGELVVEGSTIRTHVKRILMKLQLRDRIQIVIYAYETGVNRPVLRNDLPSPPSRASGHFASGDDRL
jgi:DNA-binding CsgD family transcriptional regulator